ncbi:MAG TPA: Mur ligase family protein [Thermodesulfovibrionales bacterium]|nr:Mur ligase family protein [Thermodesulfovibrionales bacterium]
MSLKPLKLFFSGIGGSGMSALACFLTDKGHRVVGSDRAFDQNNSHPLRDMLLSKGIAIVPQDGSGLDSSFDLAVFSTAVEQDRPEVIKAKKVGVPAKTRPEYLAEIVCEFKTFAVAGTSGKSTTSGMLAFMMKRLGLEPNYIGGGRVKQFHDTANPGNSITGDSDYLVIEACESDGSIVNYKPLHTVILNLDLDHHPVEATASMFRRLVENTAGVIVLNADDDNLNRLDVGDALTFSVTSHSDFRADDIVYHPFRTEFSVHGVRFALSLPGKHNLFNALSCIAVLARIGIPLKDIASVLHEFIGIERRFDIIMNDSKHLVIDDYAHNPHKIAALMETVRAIKDGVCYIFQPHGFGPTRMMQREYIDTFTEYLRPSDHLVLLPIYYAGGTAAKDISSLDLAEGIKAAGKSVEVVERREDVFAQAGKWNTLVIFGARDETLSEFATHLAVLLQAKTANSNCS